MTASASRRAQFAAEYLIDLNGAAAARRAGYATRCADRQAATLLRDPAVQAAIQAGRKRLIARAEATQEQTLAKLDWVQHEATREWERSKLNAESVISEQIAGDAKAGKRAKIQKTSKGQCADPRYLAQYLAAEDMRVKLTLGYVPTRTELTGTGGAAVTIKVVYEDTAAGAGDGGT